MFNPEQKERFINDFYYNEDTKRVVRFTFEKTAVLEGQFNTDLCRFNQNQLSDLLRYFDCSTENALNRYFTEISQYVKWSTEQGYCPHNLAFQNIFKKDLKRFINVDAVENQYIKDREELYKICDDLVNPVDRAIIVLLYEGLNGDAMSEVRLLKKNDVKIIKREIIVKGEKVRVIPNIDERSIEILNEAINENIYYTKNGESVARSPSYPIIESEYVLRPIRRRNIDGEPISVSGINIKMMSIRKWTGKHYLNPTNIFYSGIFERLRKIEVERELQNEDYRDIMEMSGINPDAYSSLKDRYELYKKINRQ